MIWRGHFEIKILSLTVPANVYNNNNKHL
jgi:hypothetical protein